MTFADTEIARFWRARIAEDPSNEELQSIGRMIDGYEGLKPEVLQLMSVDQLLMEGAAQKYPDHPDLNPAWASTDWKSSTTDDNLMAALGATLLGEGRVSKEDQDI